MPEKWREIPEVKERLQWVYTAFFEITHSRGIGMGYGSIPYEAMAFYARDNQLDADSRETLFFHIRRMDTAFLEHVANEQ